MAPYSRCLARVGTWWMARDETTTSKGPRASAGSSPLTKSPITNWKRSPYAAMRWFATSRIGSEASSPMAVVFAKASSSKAASKPWPVPMSSTRSGSSGCRCTSRVSNRSPSARRSPRSTRSTYWCTSSATFQLCPGSAITPTRQRPQCLEQAALRFQRAGAADLQQAWQATEQRGWRRRRQLRPPHHRPLALISTLRRIERPTRGESSGDLARVVVLTLVSPVQVAQTLEVAVADVDLVILIHHQRACAARVAARAGRCAISTPAKEACRVTAVRRTLGARAVDDARRLRGAAQLGRHEQHRIGGPSG